MNKDDTVSHSKEELTYNGIISAAAGAVAGLVAGIAVCPLDVVKTRLQIQGSYHGLGSGLGANLGVIDTVKSIYQESGFKGFYSGLSPLLIGYLPSWAIYFYVYKRALQRWEESYVLSAMAAGTCSTIATNPLWMIKTRLMAQNKQTSYHYKGFTDAVSSVYKGEGIRAFYKGLGPSLIGLPHVAIHFKIYESLKKQLGSRFPNGSEPWHILTASVFSKIIASTLTYPHEVVRSRNQTAIHNEKYKGVFRTVKTLYLEEGWRVFYAGLGANICRAVPSSAVTLVTFELVSNDLNKTWSSSVVPIPLCDPELTDDALR